MEAVQTYGRLLDNGGRCGDSDVCELGNSPVCLDGRRGATVGVLLCARCCRRGLAAILRLDIPSARSLRTSRIFRMPPLPLKRVSKGGEARRIADHPTLPVTPVHSVIPINWNRWSQSPGTRTVWPSRRYAARRFPDHHGRMCWSFIRMVHLAEPQRKNPAAEPDNVVKARRSWARSRRPSGPTHRGPRIHRVDHANR
jgi:hypothetical protein